MDFVIAHSYLIPLLPLIGAAIAGFFGAKILRGQSHWPIWLGVGASAVMSVVLAYGMYHQSHVHEEARTQYGMTDDAAGPRLVAEVGRAPARIEQISRSSTWYTWFEVGAFKAGAGAWFDPLTAVMLCVVCGIGFFITVFAAGYMKGESGYFRFFAYLGLFIFAMTILVMGDNFIMLYLGWEGVGLCSYLLIGYYYDKPTAREAAKKAFLVNRIGDFGFGIGIMLIFWVFGTVSFFGDGVNTFTGVIELATRNPESLSAGHQLALQWIPFCLMLGAFGKSAQFPLHVWLPDAMEGPTPVSALIHAATMVTAGVYMIARCGTLFVTNSAAMWTVAIIGAFTAIFAATIALRQFDLKKVFAYSTISQLGFMFVAVGVLAPIAGVFHLVTHAFFKALLFLSSGVVMHAMGGELDLRKMSGLKRAMPKTRWLMLIGCAALAGFPFLSGFFSKDEIVIAAWDKAPILGLVMLLTAFLTAYYTFRLYFRVFHGPEVIPAGAHVPGASPAPAHAPDPGHGHDAAHGQGGHGHDDHGHGNPEPFIMIFPLVVLAIGAVLAGYLNWPGHPFGEFLGKSPSVYWTFTEATATYGAGEIAPVPFGQPEVADERVQHAEHYKHQMFMIVSGLIALLGVGLAYVFHLKDRAAGDRLVERFAPFARLLEGKYYVDEIYQNAIVEPLRGLGRAFFAIDRIVVDGLVGVVGFVPQLAGFVLKLTTQRGYLQGYAAAMLFGVMVILLIVFM